MNYSALSSGFQHDEELENVSSKAKVTKLDHDAKNTSSGGLDCQCCNVRAYIREEVDTIYGGVVVESMHGDESDP
ncbi:hypothetical protein V6N13_120629 [Hibiscus sabdariffa]